MAPEFINIALELTYKQLSNCKCVLVPPVKLPEPWYLSHYIHSAAGWTAEGTEFDSVLHIVQTRAWSWLLLFNTEVMNALSYNYTPPYVFMVLRLVKRRDYFYLHFCL
jgi:hypothetical protein